jgi:hypothetical protein
VGLQATEGTNVGFTLWALILPLAMSLPGIVGLVAVIRYARRVRTRPTLVWAVASATGLALSLLGQWARMLLAPFIQEPSRFVLVSSWISGVQGVLAFATALTGAIALVSVLRDAAKHYERCGQRPEAAQSVERPT